MNNSKKIQDAWRYISLPSLLICAGLIANAQATTNVSTVNSPAIRTRVQTTVSAYVSPIVSRNVSTVVNANVNPVIASIITPAVTTSIAPIITGTVVPVVNANIDVNPDVNVTLTGVDRNEGSWFATIKNDKI